MEVQALGGIAVGRGDQRGRHPEKDLGDHLKPQERAVGALRVEHPRLDQPRDHAVCAGLAATLQLFMSIAQRRQRQHQSDRVAHQPLILDVAPHERADDPVEPDEVERTSRRGVRIVDRVRFLDERGDQRLLRREVVGDVAGTEIELAREVADADRRDAALVEGPAGVLEDSPRGIAWLRFRTLT